ncbi:GAF domain-containing protein [Amycolatopsis eburnea]|uniref:GAF domain-containing protein n=1 Tax=Amycolatopsis eburnea TaxID=2267691 RepID=A0A427T333_9PSEU|nr:GAF domain-containing protein [Amycolatopsis eburnea]
MRPADGDLYRRALRGIRQRTGVPLAFAGQLRDRRLVLSHFLGARTNGLRDLLVEPGKGVGGTVLAREHPHGVSDYRAARSITHDYDDPVLGEGIQATVAVPVAVRGRVDGVLYAAVRDDLPLGDRATGALLAIADGVARELAIRDEVDHRLELLGAATPDGLRAELAAIAADAPPGPLRDRLLRVCERFGGPAAAPETSLSARELDVLGEVALGCTNAEAAARLALKPETVKAYLRSAMAKLGVHRRQQAVLEARRLGVLP